MSPVLGQRFTRLVDELKWWLTSLGLMSVLHSSSKVSKASIAAAARRLADAGLVAFPTETVYGLGADGLNPNAVARIFAAKGRPSDHPVILHVADIALVRELASDWPPEAQMLADAFWPGPMTLILKRAAKVPLAVTGGQDTVGVRIPSHPVALDLLREFKKIGSGVIAAPSANRFGAVSPTRADDVVKGLGAYLGADDLILDGGDSEVGLESTIVDLSSGVVRVLRPGGVSRESIMEVLGQALPLEVRDNNVNKAESLPRVSGALDSHYAPHARVTLVAGDQLSGELSARLAINPSAKIIVMAINPQHLNAESLAKCASEVWTMPNDPALYGRQMYRQFHRADELGADYLLVERPPLDTRWEAVLDRLSRAAF
jgi:L-threonylcarbamoyladenylate synthase